MTSTPVLSDILVILVTVIVTWLITDWLARADERRRQETEANELNSRILGLRTEIRRLNRVIEQMNEEKTSLTSRIAELSGAYVLADWTDDGGETYTIREAKN